MITPHKIIPFIDFSFDNIPHCPHRWQQLIPSSRPLTSIQFHYKLNKLKLNCFRLIKKNYSTIQFKFDLIS